MKTNKFNVKHHGCFGPGGWYCTCCGPSPSERKTEARLHKKRIYRAMNRELRKELQIVLD